MSAIPALDPEDPVRFHRSFVIDSAFANRITIAVLVAVLFNPRRFWRVGLVWIVIAALAFVSLSSTTSGDPNWFLVFVAVGLPVFSFLVAVIAFFPARRQTRFRLPVGSEYTIDLCENSLRLRDSMAASALSYNLFRSLQVTKQLVALTPRRGRVPALLPRELFTPESLEWLRSRLSDAK